MSTISGVAGLTIMTDIIATLNSWDASLGGVKPKIETMWDEQMLTFNETKSYILVQIDSETPETFSMMEGNSPNYIYQWMHKVNISLDIRVDNDFNLFERTVNYTMHKLKTNVRFATAIQQFPLSISYDFTIRNQYRVVIGLRVDKESPTYTVPI